MKETVCDAALEFIEFKFREGTDFISTAGLSFIFSLLRFFYLALINISVSHFSLSTYTFLGGGGVYFPRQRF